MTHVEKLIPCLEKYNFVSKQLKNVIPELGKRLALSNGSYGKHFPDDFDSYAQQGSVAEGSFGLYNVNPDIQHYIFETDIMYYSPAWGKGWIAKQNKTKRCHCFH